MVGVFLILGLLFGAIAAWGLRGMLQVVRKRSEFAGAAGIKGIEGRAAW